jgi:tRNA 2-selenouridine synthase
MQFLTDGKIEDGFRILLKYYDKWYMRGLNNRNNVQDLCAMIPVGRVDAITNAKQLLNEIGKTPVSKKLINEPGYR